MEAIQTLEVRRVPSSEDLMQRGDYCFIAKREPIRTFEPITVDAPRGFIKKWLWRFLGKGQKQLKEIIEIRWPEYDAIVMLCPHCAQPIATTKDHRILSIEPLTVEKPLACAYSRGTAKGSLPTVAFKIEAGNIIPA